MKALLHLPRFLRNGSVTIRPGKYEIVCVCGHTAHGQREARFQVVTCTQCKKSLFVMPLSPLPRVLAPGQKPPTEISIKLRPWLGPFVAGSITFVIALVVFAILMTYLVPTRRNNSTPVSPDEIERRLAAGRTALSTGDFKAAHSDLEAAQSMVVLNPQALASEDRRRLSQLNREAALLADWPREPLEQILSRAVRLNDEEWQELVGRRFRGRAMVFDIEVRRDATGQYIVATRPIGGPKLHLDLQNLKLLQRLPLDNQQRVIFAARLQEIRRQNEDSCLVRLEPESGVLITDAHLAGILAAPLTETDQHALMKRQKQWAAEVP